MQGSYVRYENKWKQSFACYALASTQIFAMEASLSSLTLLSAMYTWAVSFHQSPELKPVILAAATVWLSCTMISLMPILLTRSIRMDLCLFHTTSFSNKALLIYNIVLHIIINGSMIMVTCVFCVKVIATIHVTQQSVRQFGGYARKKTRGSTYTWLVLQALCRILCWCPSQVLLVAALCGANISSEVMAWFTVMLMLLSSIVNPFLYTLRTIKK